MQGRHGPYNLARKEHAALPRGGWGSRKLIHEPVHVAQSGVRFGEMPFPQQPGVLSPLKPVLAPALVASRQLSVPPAIDFSIDHASPPLSSPLLFCTVQQPINDGGGVLSSEEPAQNECWGLAPLERTERVRMKCKELRS